MNQQPLNEERTIVQIVHMDDMGDSCQRMRWPAEHLAQQAPEWRVINLDFQHKDRWTYALEADLLVVFQSSDPDLLGLIDQRRSLGRKTLVEYNDNFYAPQAWSPVRKDWTNPFVWQLYEHFMEKADGILVTGQGLYDLFSKKFKTPIFILPNHYHDRERAFDDLQQCKGSPEIRIGWAGSLGHMADVLSIAPLFDELTQLHENVKIWIMGNEAIPRLVRLKESQFHFRPWSGMKEYFDFWQSVHIGVVPLIDTPYNRCRSDAKAMEMSASGALPLLPRATCYESFIEASGIKPYTDLRDLKSRLVSLIQEPTHIMQQARVLYDFVARERHHRMRHERRQLYADFMVDRPHARRSSSSSTFSWPVALGYHELKSEPERSHWQDLSSAAHALMKAKQWKEAYESLVARSSEFKDVPDFDFLLIQVKARSQQSLEREEIRALQRKHSLDWRFSFFEIHVSAEEARREAWTFLMAHSVGQPVEVFRAFVPEILRMLEVDLRRHPWAPALAEEWLRRYHPKPAALSFALAEAYERNGDNARALELMRAINHEKRAFDINRSFFEHIEGYYLEAWDAALSERIKA